MKKLGTALTSGATKVMICGCGELGKEVVIELQRLGVEVIAVDRYANAPAMQVAHKSYVINMLDGAALRKIAEDEKPNLIVALVFLVHLLRFILRLCETFSACGRRFTK